MTTTITTTTMILATIVCGLATLALIHAEWKVAKLAKGDRQRTLAKWIASGSFLALAALRFEGGTTATWIVVGLVLGAVGDIALLGRSNRAFLVGLIAFLGGHVMYVIAAATVAPVGTWATWPAIIPVALAAGCLRWLWPHLGALRVPVIVYVATITLMVVGAIATAYTGHCRYFLVGAILFFASDIAVARDKFVARGFQNKLCGLPAYFAGQLLIAWSI